MQKHSAFHCSVGAQKRGQYTTMVTHDLGELERELGFTFSNRDLLQQAMVHRSFLNEHPSFRLGNNERLEFLGDAVLELVVTEYLYLHYENPEGEMTNWRAALVNSISLADRAKEISLERFLMLSRGESQDAQKKARTFIMADAFEALIGAIYLDQGFGRAREFIEQYVLRHLPRILEQKLYLDPKSRFQEASQEQLSITPVYKVLDESGPDHAKQFRVGVFLNDEIIADGEGSSKQEAQVAAALNALKVKNWE